MSRRLDTIASVFLLALLPAGCAHRSFISWADITLSNYRDIPGLGISADEWERCVKILDEAATAGKGEGKAKNGARKLFCEGKAAALGGRTEEALTLQREAAALDPLWAMPHQAEGALLMERGDFEGAAEALGKACALDPLWVTPLGDLGVAYYHLGRLLDALDSFERAIEIDSSIPFLHSNLGNILTEIGRYDDAIKSHIRAIELEPQNPILYANMAATLEEVGDLENQLWVQQRLEELLPEADKAVVFLKVAAILDRMGRGDEALGALKKAYGLSPESPGVLAALKQFYFDHKLFAHLIDLIVAGAPKDCRKCAEECYDVGNLLLTGGDLDGAAVAYQAAIGLASGWADPWHNLGVVYNRKHSYSKSVEALGKALELEPGDPGAMVNIAMSYYRMGKDAEALEWLGKAVQAKEDLAVAHSNLGEVLRFKGRRKESLAEHERAFALDPGSCFIAAQYARLLVDMKKSGKALELLSPFDGDGCAALHMVKAVLLLGDKKPAEALAEADLALVADPSLSEAQALGALAHFGEGDKDEAKKDLLEAMCKENRLSSVKSYKDLAKKLKLPAACD